MATDPTLNSDSWQGHDSALLWSRSHYDMLLLLCDSQHVLLQRPEEEVELSAWNCMAPDEALVHNDARRWMAPGTGTGTDNAAGSTMLLVVLVEDLEHLPVHLHRIENIRHTGQRFVSGSGHSSWHTRMDFATC